MLWREDCWWSYWLQSKTIKKGGREGGSFRFVSFPSHYIQYKLLPCKNSLRCTDRTTDRQTDRVTCRRASLLKNLKLFNLLAGCKFECGFRQKDTRSCILHGFRPCCFRSFLIRPLQCSVTLLLENCFAIIFSGYAMRILDAMHSTTEM